MSPKLLSAVMVFALSPALFSAEEPADLVKLREGYQKALTEVAVPVRARYVEKLQALMKVCSQRGDLDGAVKVRQELESLKVEATPATAPGVAKVGVDATTAFRAALEGSTWTWERNGSVRTRVTFMPDGLLKTPNWKGVFKWRLTSAGLVTLDNEELGTAKLTFNPEVTTFEGVDFSTREPIKGNRVSPAQKAAGVSGDSSGGAFGRPEK